MTVEVNMAELNQGMARLAQLTGKELVTIVREQARLFCFDAMKSTPPFVGKPYAPLTEGFPAQRKAGEIAVERDISKRAMQPLERLDIFKGTGDKGSKLGPALRRMLRKKEYHNVEEILRNNRIRLRGVLRRADADLHEKLRDNRGRVQKHGGYFVESAASVRLLVQKKKKNVGLAKGGWVFSIKAASTKLGARHRVPGWLSKMSSSSSGIYSESGAGDGIKITVGNVVPKAQGMRSMIEKEALRNRIRNLPLQIQGVERALARKARQWR
jgi:hypothetical protein